MRSKINELSDFILSKRGELNIGENQFESFIEDGTAIKGSGSFRAGAYHIFSFQHNGVIWIENLPKSKIGLLMILVQTWLGDHDENREDNRLEDPRYEFVDIDTKKMDIEISIEFLDEFFIGEKEDGPVEWMGRHFEADEYKIWTAEKLLRVDGELK